MVIYAQSVPISKTGIDPQAATELPECVDNGRGLVVVQQHRGFPLQQLCCADLLGDHNWGAALH